MSEAPTMEKDDDRDDLGGAQGLLEVNDPPAGPVFGGGQIDPVEEPGRPIHMIEGEDPIDRYGVRGDLPVEEIVQFAVEGPVGAAEEIVY